MRQYRHLTENHRFHNLSLFMAAGLLLSPLMASCGGDESGGAQGPTIVDAGVNDPDIAGDQDIPVVSEDVGVDAGEETPDVPQILPDIGPSCPGAATCECTENKNCDSGWCIDTDNGKQCAQQCIETCPEGYKCAPAGSGADTVSICVPKWGNLCNPCNTNGECTSPGNGEAACVDQDQAGAFCGITCSTASECPDSYTCKSVKDINGKDVKQCVLKEGGACACSKKAIKAELSTKCWVSAGEAKCLGERKCLPEGAPGAPTGGGLSDCLAAAPEVEKCDAKDNDCDGDTDEGTCDDDNPCTDDSCGGAKGCGHTNNQADCDADDSVCTVKDVCKDGACAKGTLLDCDDKNPCTSDTCDPEKGCQHGPLNGGPCNADDNPCTPNDVCKDGQCQPGKVKACTSTDLCTVGKCSLTDGSCKYSSLKGQPCNDGNPCTLDETCDVNDLCQAKSLDQCDDKNPCTTDSCKAKVGCVHENSTATCDDGDLCTSNDGCKDGNCVGLPLNVTQDCDDKNACTNDICVKSEGCKNLPLTSTKCDDGNPCTVNDTCSAGKCSPGSNTCDCAADKDCENKEDGNVCNGTLICNKATPPFKCEVDPTTIVKCDTSLTNQCQTMACNPKSGKCELDFKTSDILCDADKSVCTTKDSCDGQGKCVKGKTVNCDDNNPCTTDSCDAIKGCVNVANTNACDADSSLCTVNDACKDKVCVPGPKKPCDDKEPCTADSCEAATGKCIYKPLVNKLCDDGNACTTNDKCGTDAGTNLFTCLAGAPKVCNDGNPCTNDACDSKTGCKSSPKSDGALCDDKNECTANDLCKSGVCEGKGIDVAKACDDSNACTLEKCDTQKGCISLPLSNIKCDDGNECTNGDQCQSGKCQPGTNICGCAVDKDCAGKEDGNLCNGTYFCDKAAVPFICKIKPTSVIKCDTSSDSFCQKNVCDPKLGKCFMQKKADKTPCNADDSVCTTSDACSNGICKAGTLLNCDDDNPCTADSCDPKTGCKTINQGGTCDADGDACTVKDFCKNGTCTVGPKKNCDDEETCTADSCNKLDGKCTNKPLVKSCSDNNQCTKGDVCGKDAGTGKYTCLSGKAVSCDDGNVCTDDSCQPAAGCKFTIDTQTAHKCYTGDPKTQHIGECKDGKALCTADGKLGSCVGDIKPAPKELCDAKDNDCDGTTDEGCAPIAFSARFATATLKGQGKKYGSRALAGASLSANKVAAPTGSKYGVAFGFFSRIAKILGL